MNCQTHTIRGVAGRREAEDSLTLESEPVAVEPKAARRAVRSHSVPQGEFLWLDAEPMALVRDVAVDHWRVQAEESQRKRDIMAAAGQVDMEWVQMERERNERDRAHESARQTDNGMLKALATMQGAA